MFIVPGGGWLVCINNTVLYDGIRCRVSGPERNGSDGRFGGWGMGIRCRWRMYVLCVFVLEYLCVCVCVWWLVACYGGMMDGWHVHRFEGWWWSSVVMSDVRDAQRCSSTVHKYAFVEEGIWHSVYGILVEYTICVTWDNTRVYTYIHRHAHCIYSIAGDGQSTRIRAETWRDMMTAEWDNMKPFGAYPNHRRDRVVGIGSVYSKYCVYCGRAQCTEYTVHYFVLYVDYVHICPYSLGKVHNSVPLTSRNSTPSSYSHPGGYYPWLVFDEGRQTSTSTVEWVEVERVSVDLWRVSHQLYYTYYTMLTILFLLYYTIDTIYHSHGISDPFAPDAHANLRQQRGSVTELDPSSAKLTELDRQQNDVSF